MPEYRASSSDADSDPSSDIETNTRPGGLSSEPGSDRDLEKQDNAGQGATDANAVPVPGAAALANGQELYVGDEVSSEEQGGVSRIVNRVLSRTSTKSNWNPRPPPDGGIKAWIAVACSHFVVMNTWGFVNCFGIFQTYYATSLSLPPSQIAWIGSFQSFLLFFIGTFTGRLTDAGYFRTLCATGTLLCAVGIFTAAQCSTYWQFFLAQGVCIGLGNGCLFCPSLAVLSTYFSKKRSFAIGMAACGSATGGLIFPGVARELLPRIGFAWTMRSLGFIQLGTLIIVNIGLRPRIPPRRGGKIVEWGAFKEAEYVLYACGSFFILWGVFVAFFFIASFSRDVIGLSYPNSLNLLLVINGVGGIGRLIPNYIADRAGTINVFIAVAFSAGILALCWTAVADAAGLYVWTCFYGFAAGGIQSLFTAALPTLTSDLRKVGVRMGMVFTIGAFATLTGPPISGAILSSMGGNYRGLQGFSGATMLVGSGFLVGARVAKGRKMGLGLWAKV